MADAPCCSAETNTTLESSYPPVKIFKNYKKIKPLHATLIYPVLTHEGCVFSGQAAENDPQVSFMMSPATCFVFIGIYIFVS